MFAVVYLQPKSKRVNGIKILRGQLARAELIYLGGIVQEGNTNAS